MKKNLVQYIIVFLLSFIAANIVLFFLIRNKVRDARENIEIIADSLGVIDSLAVLEQDSVFVLGDRIPDKLDEYRRLTILKEELEKYYAFESMQNMSFEDADSLVERHTKIIESLIERQQAYISKIEDLRKLLSEKNVKITSLEEKISKMEEKFTSLESNYSKEKEQAEETEKQNSIKYLADTYSTMDAKKVAQLMLPLTDEKIIEILRKMNQRKSGKVLSYLPPKRSASIVALMAE